MTSNSRFVPLVLETDTSFIMIKTYLHSACKSILFVFCVTVFSFSSFAQEIPTDAASISAGEKLFTGNCKACHAVKRKVIGPALGGVYDRVPSIDWIKRFVHNSSAVIASGDEYAVKLFAENNKTQMTAFTSLKDADIMNILAYIKAENDKVEETPGPGPGQVAAGADSGASKYLNVIVFGMIIILILLVV